MGFVSPKTRPELVYALTGSQARIFLSETQLSDGATSKSGRIPAQALEEMKKQCDADQRGDKVDQWQ